MFASFVDQGGRQYMEDRWSVKNLGPVSDSNWELITVADGHGGDTVATDLIDSMPNAMSSPGFLTTLSGRYYNKSIFHVYSKVDQDVCKRYSTTVGSTLCTVLLNESANMIIAANCGDTMAIVGNSMGSRWLSQEHKASSEVRMIESRGGTVTSPDGMPRVNGTLNLSRAMGDSYLKKFITASPFVTRCRMSDFEYVFVATDGVWDVMNKDEVHAVLKSYPTLNSKSLSDICTECRARRSGDNIAMVLCKLYQNASFDSLDSSTHGSRKNKRVIL